MDSRKQSLFPKPSAAKQSFCCSLWIVAELWRTTSSSYKKRDRVTRYLICSRIISYYFFSPLLVAKSGGENKLWVKNSDTSSPKLFSYSIVLRWFALCCPGIPGKMNLVLHSQQSGGWEPWKVSVLLLPPPVWHWLSLNSHMGHGSLKSNWTNSSMLCLWQMFFIPCQSHARSSLVLS